MNWQQPIETTVTGLGYELVDVERAPRGLLRVTIDRVPGRVYSVAGEVPELVDSTDFQRTATDDPEAASSGDGDNGFVTVEDCEKVTRQLQYALEVDAVAYERLEVSSPGLDRPLRREADYRRFAGQAVNITLKSPFRGRKNWRGTLAQTADGWALEGIDVQSSTVATGSAGAAGSSTADGEQNKELRFVLDEVREARLVPVLDFKGRRRPARKD